MYRNLLLGTGAVLVLFFVGMFVTGGLVPTYDTSAATSFNASVNRTGYTLSLELVGSNPGTVALSADTSAGGTWVAGKQTVRGTTNSPAGYQLYLSTTSASNALTGSNDDSNTIPAGGGTHSSPATLAVNRWGYAIPDQTGYDGAFSGDYTINTDGTISSSTTWATMPVASAPVLVDTVSGQPSGLVTTKDLNIYYGAAADVSLTADTYLGTVLYSAISDLSVASESASISPSQQTIDETNVSVNITTPLLTTTDLTTSDVTATIGGQTCPVTAVSRNPASSDNPNAVVVTCTAPGSNIVAKKDVVVSIPKFNKSYTITEGYEYVQGGPGSLQELENLQQLADYPEVCTNATVGTIATNIEDARDHQKYTIAKLADGNCWMTENLRFGALPETTPTDTPTGRAWNSTTDPSLTNTTSAGATKMQDLTYDSTNPATAGRIKVSDSGAKTADGASNAFSSSGDNYTEPYIMIYQANKSATYDGQTKYGVLYNYCAVTGGTACTDSSTDYNPTGSICPKGWKLPGMTADPTGSGATTDGTVKTYNNLFNAYGVTADPAGFNKITPSPLSFVRAGNANTGSLNYRSSSGYGGYWSSTKYSSANLACRLYFNSGSVLQSFSNRYVGFSARCVSES